MSLYTYSGLVLSVKCLISDERILEYDIDKVLYEEKSPYQKILIVHSQSLGNLLVLDGLQSKFFFYFLCVHVLSVFHYFCHSVTY
jgi:spermidine synthase